MAGQLQSIEPLSTDVAARKTGRQAESASAGERRIAAPGKRLPPSSPVDINHVSEGVTGIWPLAINKA
jgi:hypothetical protein